MAKRPQILYIACPVEGHTNPNLQVAEHLVSVGYDVTFLSTNLFKDKIEAIGCHYQPCTGNIAAACSIGGPGPFVFHPEMFTMDPLDPLTLMWVMEMTTTEFLQAELESMRHAAAAMKARNPDSEIIIVGDTFWAGIVPIRLGAPLLPPLDQLVEEPIKSLGISVVPSLIGSVDWTLLGPGFDPSPEGRKRTEEVAAKLASLKSPFTGRTFMENYKQTLLQCGILDTGAVDKLLRKAIPNPDVTLNYFSAPFVAHTTSLQMCLPALEWPVSDRPANIKFGGTLPPKPLRKDIVLPKFMDEIKANGLPGSGDSGRKKVVVVAQGTVDMDWRGLLLPTIEALGGDDSVLVVAILCVKGADLKASYHYVDGVNGASNGAANGARNGTTNGDAKELPPLPSNVRVTDYLLFDAVLPYADVFVSRSGYGAMNHGITNGVPMVQGGEALDKPEIAMHIEHSGMGLRIKGGNAEPGKVKELVTKILENPKYRVRAQELKKESEAFGTLQNVERELEALWK